MNEQEHGFLRKHAIERLELSLLQASDWLTYYAKNGPVERYQQWSNTFEQRQDILKAAIEDAKRAEEPLNSPDPTPAA